MLPTSQSPHSLLREHGLRVTQPRAAVIETLSHHAHLSADDVHQVIAASSPSMSKQSVYNVLSDLTDAGITRCIEPAGHPARYELRVGDNHHHVVCKGCGDIADIDCVVGQAPCLEPHQAHGYTIEQAEVTFWGQCPTCAVQPKQGASA